MSINCGVSNTAPLLPCLFILLEYLKGKNFCEKNSCGRHFHGIYFCHFTPKLQNQLLQMFFDRNLMMMPIIVRAPD